MPEPGQTIKCKVNLSFFTRAGKIITKMTTEFRETAGENKTLELSGLACQLGTVSNWSPFWKTRSRSFHEGRMPSG